MITIDTSIDHIPKISQKIVPALKRLGFFTLRDLLFHLPSRYEDFSNKKSIADIIDNETVTIQGVIHSLLPIRAKTSGKTIIQAVIADDSGSIKAVWFNQPYLLRTLRSGDMLNLSGKAELRHNGMCLQNPVYEKISLRASADSFHPVHTAKLVPVYPETRGITSRWLRYLIASFRPFINTLPDPLPPEIRAAYHLIDISNALSHIHFPQNREEIQNAMRRFEFEQLFMIQLFSLRERMQIQQNHAPSIAINTDLMKQFVASLPFTLTDAQRRACWEIMNDMNKPFPMNRLLQGDVGSGKTVVAAAALLLTAHAGKRAVLLAPTEILAKQHAQTLQTMLAPFDIRVGVYTSSTKQIPAKSFVFVGTHALLQKHIRISDLGLIIVDEQHRFGVKQRAALIHHHRDHNEHPHFLSMTATPIPRTLALTLFGDLDISVLDEMPKNRKQIITDVIDPEKRTAAYDFMRQEMRRGRQVFVICPRIDIAEPSEHSKKNQVSFWTADVKNVKEEYEKLAHTIFPDFRVSMLYGKMKPTEKTQVMNDFRAHNADILVSTSVVEVGVDVPNATIMMIEGAERFGLAQLHQFRGRVGRGSEQSYCFLFSTERGQASARLHALKRAKNGFELAEIDLRLRGPGDFLGTQQWGISPIGIKALTNPYLLRDARTAAKQQLLADPLLERAPLLQNHINALAHDMHRE